MQTDVATLLEELAPLTHHDRTRRMVELGRLSLTDAPARALVDSLAAHANSYGRLLALQTVFGSRDGARVLAALSDPSAIVRRRARRLTPTFCDDAQAEAALRASPPGRARAGICRVLRRKKRANVVDGFLDRGVAIPPEDGAPARFDGRVVDLVPFGTPAAQARHATALREAGSPVGWTRLAVWQPEVATEEIVSMIAAGIDTDPRARWRFLQMLPALARRSPDGALRVVRAHVQKGGDPGDHVLRGVIGMLARRRPVETFDLLREVHERSRPSPPPGVFGIARFAVRPERLGVERLAYLARLGGKPLPDRAAGLHWFRRLSDVDRDRLARAWLDEGQGSWGAFILRHVPAEGELTFARERAFTRWRDASMRSNGAIDVEHLAWLPADLREREAKRHLESTSDLATKPRERMEYARLLPFAEAKTALAPWLGHPEGEERAAALRVWVGSVRFSRASLPDALAAVKARKFEQDPVRLAMLQALGQLPIGAFGAQHLEDVGQCLSDALDAADLSHATSSAAEQLVVRLFRKDAQWGARWLSKLIGARGSASSPGLGDGLSDAEVRALAPALSELTAAWLTRERAGALLWLAASLGKRLPLVPDLVLALERCARELPFVGVASRAIDLLARRARPSFAALVPKLLAVDASFAILSRVARFVSTSRQDLLDPLLGEAVISGRFATGNTTWVIAFGGGHARWTDRQQAAHARGLLALITDPARDVPVVLSSLETLVSLAFVDPAHAIALASDLRPPVRERAVRYLSRLDGGEGAPVLVECLGDDRARFAIYALRASFAEMSSERVLAVLERAPMGKVTVAKEVLRLVGELPGPEAFRALLSFDRPDLHRDVRIALLRALWSHLDRDEAWAIFERVVDDPDWVIVSKLADIPTGRLGEAAQRRLADLLARVLRRPEVDARIALLRRVSFLPLPDTARVLLAACLARMAGPHPEESRVAAEVALHRMWPDETEVVLAHMTALLDKRRLLLGFVEVLKGRLGPHAQPPIVRIARGLLDALRADPHTVPASFTLAARLLGWKELGAMLVATAERGLLHVDAMIAAMDAVRSSTHPELLEHHLAAQGDPVLRRLAVTALAAAAGPGKGWSAERRKRLETYRADPSPLVAGAAQVVFPPDPDEKAGAVK